MPVIINPNVPIGLEDFRTLYTGNGMSPDQNAAQLALTAPQGARGYIQDQWRRTGIPQSPEQYFSNPYPAGMPGFQSNNQPLYHNEGQRNMAIALGQNHPFESPDNRMAALAQHLQGVPHPLDDPQLKQIMGEDPKRGQYIYAALTGGRNYEEDAKTAEERTYRQGQIADTRTYEEKKSQEAEAYAEQKYQQHTTQANSYSENQYQQHRAELEAAQRSQAIAAQAQIPIKAGMENVRSKIDKGATLNPNTGKFEGLVEVAGANDGTPGSDRPRMVMQEFNPETQNDFRAYYSTVTGASLPQKEIQSPSSLQGFDTTQKSLTPEQRAYYDDKVAKLTAHSGQSLSLAARIMLLRQAIQTVNPDTSVSSKILNNVTIPFEKAIGGFKQETTPEQIAADLASPDPNVNFSGPGIRRALPPPTDINSHLNVWGRIMQQIGAGGGFRP